MASCNEAAILGSHEDIVSRFRLRKRRQRDGGDAHKPCDNKFLSTHFISLSSYRMPALYFCQCSAYSKHAVFQSAESMSDSSVRLAERSSPAVSGANEGKRLLICAAGRLLHGCIQPLAARSAETDASGFVPDLQRERLAHPLARLAPYPTGLLRVREHEASTRAC